VVVQLDELERNKMTPDAPPTVRNKCQNYAIHSSFFVRIAMRFQPPKLRAEDVGVADSNLAATTKYSIKK